MELSIITINYNNSSDLEKTIKSVTDQTWKDFEFIIIDGGSTDDSIKIIRQNESSIAFWISERDKGIFNAMNKGILKAIGKYVLMLNAGDRLFNINTLHEIFGGQNYTDDILYGNAMLESKGKIVGEKIFDKPITFDFFRRTSLSHQACFIKRSLHDNIGLYDENLKFASDWKFFILAFCKFNVITRYLNCYVAECNCDGLTWSPSNFPIMKIETHSVLQEHFPTFILDYDNFDRLRDKNNKLLRTVNLFKNLPRRIYRSINLKQ